MSNKPTKILLYDLDPKLIELIEQLNVFTGSYDSLLERLTDLTPDTFDEETQAVIEDLLNGKQNGDIHIVQRVENLKLLLNEKLQEVTEQSESLRAQMVQLDKDFGTYQEVFTYDPTYGNVTKHVKSGDHNKTVDYNYADMAAGKLSTSVESYINPKGETVRITKTYTYDANENITKIATATLVTPAAG
jgi:hypothetical protein